MTSVGHEYVEVDVQRHITMGKEMWAGDHKRIVSKVPGLDDKWKFIKTKEDHSPALFNIIKEICVNAVDQCMGNLRTAEAVTYIKIQHERNGFITVANNGKGIPIEESIEASRKYGRKIYIPELVMSRAFAGSNIKKPIDSIKGGTNGLGAKIANFTSKEFMVITVYKGKQYKQIFRQGATIIDPPIITDTDSNDGTCIKMLPNYLGNFCYPEEGPESVLNPNSTLYREISCVIRLMSAQFAAYLGKHCQVYFNGTPVDIRSTDALAELYYPRMQQHTVIISSKAVANPLWVLSLTAVVLSKGSASDHITIINGTPSHHGTHIDYFTDIIMDRIVKRYNAMVGANEVKKITKGTYRGHLKFVITGPIPGARWDGQSKDKVQLEKATMSKYVIPEDAFLKIVDMLWKAVAAKEFLNQKVAKAPVLSEKCLSAPKAGKGSPCVLCLAEGDSAMGFLKRLLSNGMTVNKGKTARDADMCSSLPSGVMIPPPSFDWYGIVSLGGVIINVRKQHHEQIDGQLVQFGKWKDNVVLQTIEAEFGLNHNYDYTTEDQLATLRYRYMMICADQDLDGEGKIGSLVKSFIAFYWPELLRKGRILRLRTPVVRVTKANGDLVEEFFYENDFNKWQALAKLNDSAKYRVKYYKGLGTHDKDEVVKMGNKIAFNQSVYKYDGRDGDEALFEIYFGKDPNKRKIELSTPVIELTDGEIAQFKALQTIPVSRHLTHDTKLYKSYALHRQLPFLMDGLNPVRRKIVWASISGSKKEVKIPVMSGDIAYRARYHHGTSSLDGAIIRMGRTYPGSNQIPLIIGIGEFGDKHGTPASAPRYISGKPSPVLPLLYPKEDNAFLKYTEIEGEVAEPDYYVPILPMSILESYFIPSEGWNFKCFARDVEHTMEILLSAIAGNERLIKVLDPDAYNIINGERVKAQFKKMSESDDHFDEMPVMPDPAKVFDDIDLEGDLGDLEGDLGDLGDFDMPMIAASNMHSSTRQETKTEVLYTDDRDEMDLPEDFNDGISDRDDDRSVSSDESDYDGRDIGDYSMVSPKEYRDGFVGEIRPYKNGVHSFGIYNTVRGTGKSADIVTVNITEMPIGLKSSTFVERLKKEGKKDYIQKISNYSKDDVVNITIILNKGAYEAIEQKWEHAKQFGITPIMAFLNLHESMKPNLNFYYDGVVKSLGKSYARAICAWFPERRKIYQLRLERQKIITYLRILMITDELEFCKDKDYVRKEHKSIESANEWFSEKKYLAMNVNMLKKLPDDLKTEEIIYMITGIRHLPKGVRPTGATQKELGINIDAKRAKKAGVKGETKDDSDDEEDPLPILKVYVPKPSYSYLLSINAGDRIQSAIKRREDKLIELKKTFEEITADMKTYPFPGARIWMREILAFKEEYLACKASGWRPKAGRRKRVLTQ